MKKAGIGFIMLVMILAGCSFPSQEFKQAHLVSQEKGNMKIVATVNDESITQEDMEFYKAINLIQVAMYKEANQEKLNKKSASEPLQQALASMEKSATDKNTLLTQIIRLRAMSLLAKEKGHQANRGEVQKEVENIQKVYAAYPSVQSMIEQYGQQAFWDKQQKQYEMIVLTQKVQQDMVDKVKKENPKASSKEVNVLAEKAYEELLVSQMGTLNIQIKP